MSQLVHAPSQGHRHRKVLQLDWTTTGQKGLEAVRHTQGDDISVYYLVTNDGKEVLHTSDALEAEQYIMHALGLRQPPTQGVL